MAGKITFIPSKPKACESYEGCEGRPGTRYEPGTIWTCDDCGQEWVMVAGAQYNEPYKVWRKLNKRNRNGEDLF